ncbi:sortase [Micromonospora sp. NBC_00898]|uniref:sortase domain-containing protein n=1 Tax=Micromonospora sp. NBC_00898 TaxID=2975981 RepID=UPI00386D49D8|nr:sortase [Micromonospora sp. NBC_00898]
MTTGPGPAIRRHRARRAPRAALGAAGVALCLAAGTGVGLAGTTGPPSAAAPPAAAAWRPGCATDCPTPVPDRPAGAPDRVRVPRIGVDSPLTVLGLDRAGALVPPADFARAGWYGGGPSPGDPGPAVLAGHLDSRAGPAVFAHLGELRPGDRVEVRRGDPVADVPRHRVAARRQGPLPHRPGVRPHLRAGVAPGHLRRRLRPPARPLPRQVVVFAVAESPADPLPG